MPIESGNIKFVKSQVMQDTPDGGGRATSAVIADGASNEIFPDISEMDRAGGRVRIRKVFLTVDTGDADLLLGANVCIAKPPTNPGVSISLFTDGDYFSRREAARNRIEAYLFRGSQMNVRLLNTHLTGQTTLTLAAEQASDLPAPGQNLLLSDAMKTAPYTAWEQYVRLTSLVAETEVEFKLVNASGNNVYGYKATARTYALSDALRHDFVGAELVSELLADLLGRAKVNDVVVADSARYFGATPLAASVAAGDVTVQATSIWNRLVPSSVTEIPLPDYALGGDAAAPVAIAATPQARTFSRNGLVYFTPTAIMPGSVVSNANGQAGGVTDDMTGVLMASGVAVGSVNYRTGQLAFNAAPSTASFTVQWLPAATPEVRLQSAQRAVTEDNRSATWAVPLSPKPARGTVVVEYRAQGKWYALSDSGNGMLAGADPAYGAGTVNYDTGTVTVTLGALPDAYSSVVVFWSAPQLAAERIDPAAGTWRPPMVEAALPAAIAPGSLALSWQGGAAQDDGANGLSGDAVGVVDYVGGVVRFRPHSLPAPGAAYHFTWDAPAHTSRWTGNGNPATGVVVTLSGAPIKPGSLATSFLATQTLQEQGVSGDALVTKTVKVAVHDDGLGNWVADNADQQAGVSGGIDYATGALSLSFAMASEDTVAEYVGVQEEYWYQVPGTVNKVRGTRTVQQKVGSHKAATQLRMDTGAVAISYLKMDDFMASVADQAYDLPASQATLDLALATVAVGQTIVPGSLLFALNGNTYFDRGGVIYVDPDAFTGAGTPAGSIDYSTGIARLSWWAAGAFAFTLFGGLVDPNVAGRAAWTGRTAIAPIKPGSFFISGTRVNGAPFNVAADADGTIDEPGIKGTIDVESGLFSLFFAPDNEAAPLAEQLAAMVLPKTATYSAVGYTYLPMDANQLGLDPTRLPSDGRVPVFRTGDFLVLGKTVSLPAATVANGDTVSLGATDLARARIIGSDGAAIHTGWRVNLATGEVAIENVSGWNQPVTISGRVEDMRRISDVQINGKISLTAPVNHPFDPGDICSSALVLGDLFARYSNLFDQQTWNNVWADAQVGNPATATYDDAAFPVIVDNNGCITQRWAIRFDNATTISVIGEQAGIVWQGGLSGDIAPINPATGTPYFTMPAGGFGGGWSTGNVIRFNTVGAATPIWVIETVQQGTEAIGSDAWELLARGDVDAP